MRERRIEWLARLVLVVPIALLAWALVTELLAGEPAGARAPVESAAASAPDESADASASAATAAEPGAGESGSPQTLAIPNPALLERYVPEWARYQVLDIAIWQFAAAFLFVLVGLVARKV
ncbi:MAG: hypothetical protein ISS74_07255, partial [Planctomycetes bacterium]|nr:hypothetical protein [Planctomycetota bacterium]